MLVAPSMTWLFVSTSPVDVRTIPVPAARAFWSPRVVFTSTSPGSTRDAIAEASEGLPGAEELLEPDEPEPNEKPPDGKSPEPDGKPPEPNGKLPEEPDGPEEPEPDRAPDEPPDLEVGPLAETAACECQVRWPTANPEPIATTTSRAAAMAIRARCLLAGGVGGAYGYVPSGVSHCGPPPAAVVTGGGGGVGIQLPASKPAASVAAGIAAISSVGSPLAAVSAS